MEFRGVLFRSLAAAPGRALGRAAARRFQSVASRNEDRAGSALADGLAAVQLDAELVGDHLLAARLLAGLAAQVIAVRRLVLLEFLEGQRDLLARGGDRAVDLGDRSEEHTSELQSLMRLSYAVFCLKKKHKK